MSPEVQGALVGVGGTLLLALIGYALKGLIASTGKGNGRHCTEHYQFVERVAALTADVDWICEVLHEVYGNKIRVPRKQRAPITRSHVLPEGQA